MITLQDIKRITALDLEHFYYKPEGAIYPKFIGICVEGLKRKYNENGNQISALATIPARGGTYEWVDQTDEEYEFSGSNQQLLVTFIDTERSKNNFNSVKAVFDNNYLLNLSLHTINT